MRNNHKPIKATTSYIRWIIIVLILMASGVFVRSFVAHDTSLQVPVVKEIEQEPTEADSEISGKYYGLCTKNSVRSVKDFRSTVEKDPVLARHFEGFNWQTAHLGRQDNEVWTYVSYRKGEIIRRTSKPVRLPKGDGYITDGTRVVRTFCCNDYVIAPASERVDGPPRPEPLERVDGPPRPIAGPEPDIDIPTHETPPLLDKSLVTVPSSITPISNGGGGGSNSFSVYSTGTQPNKPTTSIPEPSTFILLIAGITVITFLRSKTK